MRANAGISARAEHISLGTDEEVITKPRRGPKRVRAALDWRSTLRGIRVQIEVLEDHHVHIRYLQPRKLAKEYSVDLRFVNAKPLRERCVAWITLAAAVATLVTAVTLLWPVDLWATLDASLQMSLGIVSATAALSLLAVFFQWTTESLTFRTVHGEAPLIRVTGGLGSCRKAKAFFVELIKSINLAHAHAPTTPQAFLRDEMREHHRLRTCGALTEGEYEASKARILAAHGG